MEERIIDKDDERLIRLKKTAQGETDAQDALTEESAREAEEEEVLVTLPEDEEYDEDLVGLTPSQLAKELERRRKAEEEARAECAKLASAADEALAAEDFEKAESLFSQATCYSFADGEIVKGLWRSRTKNFTELSPFFVKELAEEFASCDEASKAFVLKKVREPLTEERAKAREEIERISPNVLEKQEERRLAFAAHKRYYTVRLLIFLGVLALFAVAVSISASYIVRTLSILPVVLTGVFGGFAVAAFVVTLVFFVKFMNAKKLCAVNEKLSSTEEGARLEELQARVECLDLALEDHAE